MAPELSLDASARVAELRDLPDDRDDGALTSTSVSAPPRRRVLRSMSRTANLPVPGSAAYLRVWTNEDYRVSAVGAVKSFAILLAVATTVAPIRSRTPAGTTAVGILADTVPSGQPEPSRIAVAKVVAPPCSSLSTANPLDRITACTRRNASRSAVLSWCRSRYSPSSSGGANARTTTPSAPLSCNKSRVPTANASLYPPTPECSMTINSSPARMRTRAHARTSRANRSRCGTTLAASSTRLAAATATANTFDVTVHRAWPLEASSTQPAAAKVVRQRSTVVFGRFSLRARALSPIGWLCATPSSTCSVVTTLRTLHRRSPSSRCPGLVEFLPRRRRATPRDRRGAGLHVLAAGVTCHLQIVAARGRRTPSEPEGKAIGDDCPVPVEPAAHCCCAPAQPRKGHHRNTGIGAGGSVRPAKQRRGTQNSARCGRIALAGSQHGRSGRCRSPLRQAGR